MNLESSVSSLNRVGEAAVKRLDKIGIHTIEDLIFYFPFRYDDYCGVLKIKDLQEGAMVSVRAKVELIANRRSFKTHKILTEALVSDDTGSLRIMWFNQPYVIKNIKPGDIFLFTGTVKADMLGLQLIAPNYERAVSSENVLTAKLVPVYYLTAGLSQKHLRFLMKQALFVAQSLPDYLPSEILEEQDFLPLNLALQRIHFPEDENDLANSQKRLKFDELFLIQLKSELSRQKRQLEQASKIQFKENEIKELVKRLPFTLTKSQKISTWEILKDLEKNNPMNRLLSGDVGSGKTVVAAISMYCAVLNGFQTIMMAPTEILAKQHFESLAKLLGKNLNIALLTRSQFLGSVNNQVIEFKKKNLIQCIGEGQFEVVLGTHALLSEKIVLNKLALVVIDEQHRFGVQQRKLIKEKITGLNGLSAHFLSMTATPIPRSLALTMYGDLDLSVIDEMPIGRKAVTARLVESYNRQKAYDFIAAQVKKGRQAFVVCPLILPTNNLTGDDVGQLALFDSANEKKSVMKEYEYLSKQIFPNLNIGYLHGKMPPKEKDAIMEKFKKGEINILISTAVVEVGIDIPNASVMMIEGAERFGLAQLHQFRGRVGRAQHQSYCLLSTTNETSGVTLERLKFFEKNNSGFKLAEKDLETRGPGEVYGTSQSGQEMWRLARPTDYELIKIARTMAKRFAMKLKKYPKLKEKIKDFITETHWE
ncbi:MAG: ATP-dependent DNA helicase RecG [Candidatus Magasanikbacteria bacterium]